MAGAGPRVRTLRRLAGLLRRLPAGFRLESAGGATRAVITNFWEMVFNPSSVPRLLHVLIGSYVLAAFFVMSISAYYLLKRRHEEFARRSFSGALLFATIFSLAQLASGHSNARMVARNQPARNPQHEQGDDCARQIHQRFCRIGQQPDRTCQQEGRANLPGLRHRSMRSRFRLLQDEPVELLRTRRGDNQR